MCFRGGGQRSMVKDHKMTIFFWDPSLSVSCRLARVVKQTIKVGNNCVCSWDILY